MPLLLLVLFLYCVVKRIAIFDAFIEGGKEAISLIMGVFPYLVGIFFMVEMASASGFVDLLEWIFSPVFTLLGIPEGIFKLVIFRPFSGSGSIAILQDIFKVYGVDSLEGEIASTICGASETVFYLVAIYFSANGIKKLRSGVCIAIFCSLICVVLSSIFVKVL